VGFTRPLGSSCWLLAFQTWFPEAFCARQTCGRPKSTVSENTTDDFSNRRNIISREFLLPSAHYIPLYAYMRSGPPRSMKAQKLPSVSRGLLINPDNAQNPSMSEMVCVQQLTLNGRTFAGHQIRLPVSRMSIWTQAFRTSGNQSFLETALS